MPVALARRRFSGGPCRNAFHDRSRQRLMAARDRANASGPERVGAGPGASAGRPKPSGGVGAPQSPPIFFPSPSLPTTPACSSTCCCPYQTARCGATASCPACGAVRSPAEHVRCNAHPSLEGAHARRCSVRCSGQQGLHHRAASGRWQVLERQTCPGDCGGDGGWGWGWWDTMTPVQRLCSITLQRHPPFIQLRLGRAQCWAVQPPRRGRIRLRPLFWPRPETCQQRVTLSALSATWSQLSAIEFCMVSARLGKEQASGPHA